MSPPDVPDSDPRSPLIPKRVVPCLPADLEATRSVRDRVRPAVAEHGRGYLDRLIHKPWGSEFRVYEDDLADVWCLYLHAGQRTSLHCHPRKRTALLCLEGTGTVSTHGGVRYAFQAGDVLHIQPGAYHRAAADSRTGLRLVEVESPKDKFDLVRIADDFRNVDAPYEGEDHAALGLLAHDATPAAPLALQPFVEQRLPGYRRARLRAPSATGRYRFRLESGGQVRTSTDLVFAIACHPRAVTPIGLTVLGPPCLRTAASEAVYLTIRNQGANACYAQ
jgi:mannose-6-phosphate isomerase-like protein (cupin superfamily)